MVFVTMKFNSKKLKRLMADNKYTVNRLCGEFFIRGEETAAPTINAWMQGRSEPTLAKASVLASIFDMTVDDFIIKGGSNA
jgi:transcriptional regulator with XRE-family HTH domain